MRSVIFLGTNFKSGKGGIASVLKEYSKIFPEAYYISTTASSGLLTNLYTFIFGLTKFLWLLTFNRNIEIVHIHGASYISFYRKYVFFIVSRIYNKKVIYHIHGAKYNLFYSESGRIVKALIKSMLIHVDCIVCLSRTWANFFTENFGLKKIEIIPNIVACPSFLEKDISLKNTNPFQFLFLGYISERKGVWHLLETLNNIKAELNGKALFYIGGNGEINTLVSLIAEYQLEGIVKYIGWVSDEEKKQYLEAADAFILPSYNEGLPIAILEALAYQLPVISSDVGGIPEIIKTGKNGILTSPGNREQLTEAIYYFINNPELISKYSEYSIEIVKEYFPENVKLRLNLLYASL